MKNIKKIVGFIWYEFVLWVLRLTFYPLFLITAEGQKNVPRKGPVMLLSNHQSYFDPMFCQLPLKRHVYHVARSTLYNNKLFGLLLSTLNTIPIRRGEADVAAIKKIIATLKEDKVVCLYPEGERTSDGRIGNIKTGFSLLSRRSKAVVIPIAIEGAYQCWPRHKKMFTPGKRIELHYGKCISAEEVKKMTDRELAENLSIITSIVCLLVFIKTSSSSKS